MVRVTSESTIGIAPKVGSTFMSFSYTYSRSVRPSTAQPEPSANRLRSRVVYSCSNGPNHCPTISVLIAIWSSSRVPVGSGQGAGGDLVAAGAGQAVHQVDDGG